MTPNSNVKLMFAGLAGYKMLRRTRGIEEFDFEQYEDKVALKPCCLIALCYRLDIPDLLCRGMCV
jgi:hypothetical protein